MDKLWEISSYQEKNKKNEILKKLLTDRGIKSSDEKDIYLKAALNNLSDPFELPNIQKAVERINKAVENSEKIAIYGDYDVDGITSTALLYRFFKNTYNLEVDYFIPDRIEDGYGLSKSSLEKLLQNEVDLIITVDCGITAFKEAEYLNKKNVDLIITDHHTPSEKLPTAEAVINHHLVEDEDYFASEIAGVGTAYKLIEALNYKQSREQKEELLPIVALGTVADIAPLKGENRVLVKNGLNLIKSSSVLGLKLLINKLDLNEDNISAGQIGFIIAPPLNAAGRIDNAEKALDLLITEDRAQAEKIAEDLIKINKKRQNEEEKIYKKAEEKVKKLDLKREKALILADSDWHSGIIGIVASRLLEKYHLPVILFAVDDDKKTAKGSARSISSLNIYQALNYCSSELINFGGHRAAAGLTVNLDQLENFRNKFNEYLNSNLKAEDYLRKRKIDLNLKLSQLNKDLINKINDFRPFGVANPAPKFIFRNLKSKNCYQIGKDKKHLKMHFNNDLEAVAFNFGEDLKKIKNSQIDLIAQPEINKWKGKENLQLKVNDYRLSSDISTPLIFSKGKYKFYDFRETKNKKDKLKKLLTKKEIKKAAVYINHKNSKNELSRNYPDHYFFGKRFNSDADFSHLIFYSLPFSLKQFNSIIKKFDSPFNKKIKVILLFNENDSTDNKKIIKKLNKKEIEASAENELDFKGSMRYNKLSRRMDNFIKFKNLIFKENLFDLIKNVSNFEEEKNES